MNNMLSRWVPVAERSRSLALVYSGMFIGSILGLGLSPHMIAALGWPSVFYVFGSMGVAWYMFWRSWAASAPANDPKLSPEERAYILANTSAGAKGARRIPWRLLLSRREVWAIIVCHFCHNWGTFILLTWMPTYYNQVR
jgi:ACS family sodium-dependent inorganic phosphate cotransporter